MCHHCPAASHFFCLVTTAWCAQLFPQLCSGECENPGSAQTLILFPVMHPMVVPFVIFLRNLHIILLYFHNWEQYPQFKTPNLKCPEIWSILALLTPRATSPMSRPCFGLKIKTTAQVPLSWAQTVCLSCKRIFCSDRVPSPRNPILYEQMSENA